MAVLSETPLVYALVGNPNCGKSTLFNALTGLRQKVGNYPGVTVEKKVGECYSQHGRRMTLIDLPGSYSLNARSPDESVMRDVLLGRGEGGAAALAHGVEDRAAFLGVGRHRFLGDDVAAGAERAGDEVAGEVQRDADPREGLPEDELRRVTACARTSA